MTLYIIEYYQKIDTIGKRKIYVLKKAISLVENFTSNK